MYRTIVMYETLETRSRNKWDGTTQEERTIDQVSDDIDTLLHEQDQDGYVLVQIVQTSSMSYPVAIFRLGSGCRLGPTE